MARTPLLRAIRRLAADHGVADQLGIQPAEVRAERRAARQRDGSLRRREFLKLMAATGAATVLGGIRSAEGGGMAAPARIAIVGAGISGLTAALTLRDAGVDATVYEASGRLGGRISSLTNYWNEGQVSEWCGEQIDTNHEIVLGLASRFGLLVDDLIEAEPEGASETYFFQGGYYTEREADRDFGRVSKRLEADLEAAGDTTTYDTHTPAGIAPDNMSVAEWIDLRVPNGRGSRFGKLLDIAYEIEGGAPTGDQSALNLIYLLGDQPDSGPLSLFGTSDGRYHIAGGNQRLPEAIAAALGPGTGIRTGYRLVRIEQTRGTVKLTFLTRGRLEMVEADLALLTIPFAVLRTLDYQDARFDRLKHKAIQELGAGQHGKLALQFDSRLWTERGPWGISSGSSYSETGYQSTWEATGAQPGASGILPNFTGGGVTTSAFDSESPYGTACDPQVGAYARRFLAQLEPVFPGLSQHWNGKATVTLPALNPNFNLSYGYYRVSHTTRSAATPGCDRATSSSAVSIAPRSSRGTWRVARPRACALPRRSWPRSARRRRRWGSEKGAFDDTSRDRVGALIPKASDEVSGGRAAARPGGRGRPSAGQRAGRADHDRHPSHQRLSLPRALSLLGG